MSDRLTTVSGQCKEQIELMTPRQKLATIEELTTNVQALRTLTGAANQVMVDALDDGEIREVNMMGVRATNLIYTLTEKLALLRESLDLPNTFKEGTDHDTTG
tara:strand:- start:185430 stop:185738 length:309 start_codon:yes stop_codon:yes gene_type:complete